ncbi:MAG TPA: hypothetical protein VLS88_04090 [Polyangiales bacterium]|nr:hypothetical protein [Polyangiales bacterium]
MRKILLSWSSGKDSAWALRALQSDPSVEVAGLLTTVNRRSNRVAMHAVRETLLEMQARALRLPLTKVYIPDPCTNAEYERAMAGAMENAKSDGIEAIAFGDLFLEDVRRYREEKLAATGIEPIFPLWGADTRQLAREMVAEGLRAIVTCVDPKQLDRAFLGRVFDAAFLDALPEGVDPCGEKGEFHSFVYAGPMFAQALPVARGKTMERDHVAFIDVVPVV